jgi:hypothetical protein
LARARRASAGCSYLGRVYLVQTGRWVGALGRVAGRHVADQSPADVGDLLAACESPFGQVTHVTPTARLSETPPFWASPPVPAGTHEAGWPT